MKHGESSKILRLKFVQWMVEVMPDDGARISRLAFRGQDLLTPPPRFFTPPRKNYGQYEKRPVYGYDDCFPTVDPCLYPAGGIQLPDHGEVCRLKSDCFVCKSGLKCVFISRLLPFVFEREMIFKGNRLSWIFTVINTGGDVLPFIHVMHPLMKVSKIRKIDLPSFAEIIEEPSGKKLAVKKADAMAEKLISSPGGQAHMFLLRGVKEGFFRVHFCGGLSHSVSYDRRLFPTLGIWWNRRGYPDEKGLARDECAFEPIPGDWSSFKGKCKRCDTLSVLPRRAFTWQVEWQVDY